MSYVFCNQCGHRNPPVSAFCSACGTVLDLVSDHTITLSKVDPLQDAPGPDDDVHVSLSHIASGTAILVLRSGESEGNHFVLSSPITTVGRHADSEIALDDITVSRRHCEIHHVNKRFIVRDAGSLNGTYVNQKRVDDVELRQGDEIQIGKFHMVFLERPDEKS
ncbi:MAG: FHA domain-containing protein [Actinomycetota bacterium]